MATATAAKPTARPMSKTEVVSGIAEETGLVVSKIFRSFVYPRCEGTVIYEPRSL